MILSIRTTMAYRTYLARPLVVDLAIEILFAAVVARITCEAASPLALPIGAEPAPKPPASSRIPCELLVVMPWESEEDLAIEGWMAF
jgi:hypothetical protein